MTTSQSKNKPVRIAAFESRRMAEMEKLIERTGAVPFVSPSMREVIVEEDRPAIDFCNRLITGQIDVAIFLTGVGVTKFFERIQRHVPRQRVLDTLADIQTVVRGPKPLAAVKAIGITPSLRVPPPNTWREILSTLDAQLPVANQVVGVLEYGVPNVSLNAGLEARGATVESVSIYRWDLPEDIEPLKANVRRIIAGEIDLAMFTSAQQVVHLLKIAGQLQQEEELRQALTKIAIASIGPTTSEMLRSQGLSVDFEPSVAKMGHLIKEATSQAEQLQKRKQQLAAQLVLTKESSTDGQWDDTPFMRACRGLPTPYTPTWLMRQAGRYMAEYRAVREKTSFLELCENPQLCSEVMCTAVDKLGVDAAIIFSDLLPILQPMGLDLEFVAGDGPRINNPVRSADDVGRVKELENVDALHYVVETVSQTRKDLPADIPLIGFAGAPFTLASYAIEGGGSKSYLHTKTLMYREPAAWNDLMQRLSHSITIYLNAQIAAGAQVVQLFDSWVGCLAVEDYRTFVMPHVASIIGNLSPGTPVIHFGTGNPALLGSMTEAGGDVIGIDWRINLASAWQTVGTDRAVQGNLEPLVLLADQETIASRAQDVLDAAANRPGHIFNLGHGVLPQTPVENARFLVDYVRQASARQ